MTRIMRTVLTAAAASVLLAIGIASSNGARGFDAIAEPATAAELEFPDAAMGVDHMVTGPTTTRFKQQQAAANCDTAVWPNVPIACYPKR